MKIAFQGRLGAYSEKAAKQIYGLDIELMPCYFFEDVFLAVQKGEAEAGVIPIENSTAGSVHENYDLLSRFRLPIVAETQVKIEHVLLAPPGASLESLLEVYSHPQALAQCSEFFHSNPQIRRVTSFDTAGAAEEIAAQKDISRGAIASETAVEHYELQILKREMENIPGLNLTRFFSVRKEGLPVDPEQQNKTSLVFSPTEEHGGVLYQALGIFACHNINLTRIESRPRLGSPWAYIFYLDFEGHPGQEKVDTALAELEAMSEYVHILGTFPASFLRSYHFEKES